MARRYRRSSFRYPLAAFAAGTVIAAVTTPAAAGSESLATVHAAPVTAPASLVNPLIGTSGAVNAFPGPDMPFGMVQWSPDTYPVRPQGGGYSYTASQITGYSLTHLSGPGCDAYGDVPILPTVGAIGTNPSADTESFSHASETARAGYYADTLGNGVAVRLTDTTRAGIATFTFPRGTGGTRHRPTGLAGPATTQANLLLKLDDSESVVDATQEQVIGDDEVAGSVTAGHFCGMPLERDYTLHFDITFSQPFTATSTWSGTSGTGATIPGGIALTFDTSANRTVTAKAGISFTSDANAALNREAEIPGWDFGAVRHANLAAWNAILRRIEVTGGTAAQQTGFYTALYHALLYPSVFSDTNGQYTGFDGTVRSVARGHAEYANYSGWDIYRAQVQLAAMLAPGPTSDAVTSMLKDYAQTGLLPKWNLGNGESYVMAGDPADPIIADAYAFGARGFDVTTALRDMIAQASGTNNIRPGQQLLARYGYLPADQDGGCCNYYGPVSTQLEYDTADYAIAALAAATGDDAAYRTFAASAQNWQNVFNPGTGYIQAKMTNGTWLGGFTPATKTGFIEGTSAQYTPMVPFALRTLITAAGGNGKWITRLNGLMSNITRPGPLNADLSNEPSLEIPWEYDYAGAPYLTQQAVREVREELYSDTPAGEPGNDDLGTLSAAYVWDELGFYPQTPGTPVLVLASPAFPRIVIDGKIVIEAPGAPASGYVQGLTVNGQPWNDAWVNFATLSHGATLSYNLASTPDPRWAAAGRSAPPSDSLGSKLALTSAGPAGGLMLSPGGSGTASLTVDNLTARPVMAYWTASPPSGLTLRPRSGAIKVPAAGTATVGLTVTAGPSAGGSVVGFSAPDPP